MYCYIHYYIVTLLYLGKGCLYTFGAGADGKTEQGPERAAVEEGGGGAAAAGGGDNVCAGVCVRVIVRAHLPMCNICAGNRRRHCAVCRRRGA